MKKISICLLLFCTAISCKYLDVVPDGIATIDNAFTMRQSAEKFLFTCYSYMPQNGNMNTNLAFSAADEIWHDDPPRDVNVTFYNIARGLQNVANPLGNYWSGGAPAEQLYIGIRDCNIFLENIGRVRDLPEFERKRWIAEVKFLKAYYHFFLFRLYGPIPVVRENLPISATPEQVQVEREPVDSCVSYIVQLLDEVIAEENLPDKLAGTEASELGRITKPIAYALKAKVLVTAASPFFNGNTDYGTLKLAKGPALFDPNYKAEKWGAAVKACQEAIDFCHSMGYGLYHFPGNFQYTLNDTIQKQLDIRAALTSVFNNPEVIWHNTNSFTGDLQRWSMPLIAAGTSTAGPKGILAPTLKMAEMYYTRNGVPITEDKTFDYNRRFALRKAVAAERFYIKDGEETVQLHFDREPRFYASISFDRGTWFGNWVNNYDVTKTLHYVQIRFGEVAARRGISNYSVTGYGIKKLVNIETSCAADGNFTANVQNYPWPELRLADLYLLYSEALNEANGYTPETTKWINLVRERAGLGTVETSWETFAKDPLKYRNKEGLRDIIRRERTIELAFEGSRFYDLRRWKTAHLELNSPIKGWDITQKDAASYYKERLLFNQRYSLRDYLFPIQLSEVTINPKLVQNPGW
ncbi:RagB/SusD family nutrient uptake outer membrane protein [Chitinophaga lutea]